MRLAADCPRCPSPVSEENGGWHCPDHGPVQPLWRASKAGYDDFADYLQRPTAMPSLAAGRWRPAGW